MQRSAPGFAGRLHNVRPSLQRRSSGKTGHVLPDSLIVRIKFPQWANHPRPSSWRPTRFLVSSKVHYLRFPLPPPVYWRPRIAYFRPNLALCEWRHCLLFFFSRHYLSSKHQHRLWPLRRRVFLSPDFEYIYWDPDNHIVFAASKTSLISVSLEHHSFSLHLPFHWFVLRFTEFDFSSVCPFVAHQIVFPTNNLSHCARNWLSVSRKMPVAAYLLPQKAQICPEIEYCSYMCGGCLSTSLSLVDRVQ